MSEALRTSLKSALASFSTQPLREASLGFFKTLGYSSQRTVVVPKSSPRAFIDLFAKSTGSGAAVPFDQERALFADWLAADLLFQLTDQELSREAALFLDTSVSTGQLRSYIFFAVELKERAYPRGKLANLARQLNRLFPTPVMVLIKHRDLVSLAVINRRPNKLDQSKDVLGRVTLIRDIALAAPHRGHLDILVSLATTKLEHPEKKPITDFDTLHAAWEQIFNVELLNTRFYQDLANWYFWALPQVEFPADLEPDSEKRRATGLIRLLTRLIFCWFLKEKELIPDKLFHPADLAKFLKGFDPESATGSTYYQAILQNLFFATLNQRMGKDGKGQPHRAFAKDEGFLKNKATHDINNLYRYESLFADGPEAALALFADVPFLNGGLFECLDRTDETTEKKRYLDGFSRNPKRRPHVPDRLFFDSGETANLTEAYGDKKRKAERVTGLIHILNRYKFTIVENTPIDQEIALDPELLGKVFENLLASYNEETKTTARKQTGSFYTPRPIVDYMVDEALKAHLCRILVEKTVMSELDARAGLDLLFAYTEKKHPFTATEVAILIAAIDALKILDPACGSGAFPMGVLHKLVYILQKLDPGNERWKETQLAKLDSPSMREELERAFAENNDDYGRKLSLVENCLYGVDIQPIAIQITKLRFFISLVADQNTSRDKAKNLNIKPLPNLETKFVAANTLIGLPEMTQSLLVDPRVGEIEKEIEKLYHNHFSEQRRDRKLAGQRKVKALRHELAKLLSESLMAPAKAKHIAEWDAFDPQASADFFDPHWMYGQKLSMGFDIVIGNPPYGAKLAPSEKELLSSTFPTVPDYETANYFICRSHPLLRDGGLKCFIIPNTWLVNRFGRKFRQQVASLWKIVSICDCSGVAVFEAAAVRNSITLFQKHIESGPYEVNLFQFSHSLELRDINKTNISSFTTNYDNWLTHFSSAKHDASLVGKIKDGSRRLRDYAESSQGLIPYDKYRGHDEFTIQNRIWHASEKRNSTYKPELQGKEVTAYSTNWSGKTWISYGQWLAAPRNPKFFTQERILIREITNPKILAALTREEYYNTPSIINITDFREIDPYFLLGLLNSRLLTFYHIESSPKSKKGLFPKILVNDVRELPIRIGTDKHAEIIADLARRITRAKEEDPKAETEKMEREIDQQVYALYCLTPDEIAMVEGTAK
jgi:adenine-specific DNA-methyltransferase